MQRLLETIKTNMELGPVCCLSGCVFPRQATNSREVADIARYSHCRASNMCKKIMQSQGLRVSHSVKLTLACTSRAVGAVGTVASSGDPDVVPNAARP